MKINHSNAIIGLTLPRYRIQYITLQSLIL
jgi:hypothetical protein